MSRPLQYLLIFTLGIAPFYAALLNPDHALLFRDLSLDIFPAKSFFWKSIHEGTFPLWNQFVDGGYFFFGDPHSVELHPLNFLFLLSGNPKLLPYLFSWWIAIPFGFFSLGFFVMANSFGINRKLSAILAIGFTWSGPIMSLYCLPHQFLALSPLPWFIMCLQRYRSTKEHRAVFLSAVFLFLSLNSGDPFHLSFYSLLTCFFWVPWKKENWTGLFFLGFYGILLSLPVILPFLDQFTESARNGGLLDDTQYYAWAYHPKRMIEWILPYFHGSASEISSFSGKSLTNTPLWGFFIWDSHLGFISFFILTCAGLQKNLRLNARGLAILFGALIFLVLSMGHYGYLFSILRAFLPLWSKMRYTERILPWFTFFFFWFCLEACRNLKINRRIEACCILLLALQFFLVTSKTIVTSPTELIEARFPSASAKILRDLEKLPPLEASRIYVMNPLRLAEQKPMTTELATRNLWENLSGNTASQFELEDSSGYLSLHSASKILFRTKFETGNRERFLLLSGVRYLLYGEGGELKVGVNPNALPKFFFRTHFETVPNQNSALDRALVFDPSKNLILEKEPENPFLDRGDLPLIKEIQRSANQMKLKIVVPGNFHGSYLVWNESFHKYWRANANGENRPIYRANAWSMALPIPEADKGNEVEIGFDFKVPYFIPSLFAPLVGIGLFILLTLFKKKRQTPAHV